jgi:hypothetical protein
MNNISILQNVSLLSRAVTSDLGDNPLCPLFSQYGVAALLRQISEKLHPHPHIQTALLSLAKELVIASSDRLATDWEDDYYQLIHPKYWYWYWPWPRPNWHSLESPEPPVNYGSPLSNALPWRIGPRPQPWGLRAQPWDMESGMEPLQAYISPAMNDILLAHALRQLASLTSCEKISSAIKEAGETIIKTSSSKLFDDYCGTLVPHYVPPPRPKVTAA